MKFATSFHFCTFAHLYKKTKCPFFFTGYSMNLQNRENIHKFHELKIIKTNLLGNLRVYYLIKIRALQSVF